MEMDICLSAQHDNVFDMIRSQRNSLFLLYLANLILPSIFVYILYRSLHDRVKLTQEYLEGMGYTVTI